MEVQITVPKKANLRVVEKEYPDIYQDGDEEHDDLSYFVGKSSDETLEKGETEWMTRDEAIACCGFVEGAIPGAETMLEGTGGWAQGMLSRKDFSGLAIDDAAKREYKRESDIYWKAFRRGKRLSANDKLRHGGASEPETIAHGICDACGRESDNLLVINSAPCAGICVCNPECATLRMSHRSRGNKRE